VNPGECLVLFAAICKGFKGVLVQLPACATATTVFTKPSRLKPSQIAAHIAIIFVKYFVSSVGLGFF